MWKVDGGNMRSRKTSGEYGERLVEGKDREEGGQ